MACSPSSLPRSGCDHGAAAASDLRRHHPGARHHRAVRQHARARRAQSRRPARRDPRLRRPLRRRQVGADAHHHRAGAEGRRPHRGVRRRSRCRRHRGAARGRAALGHPVPAGRAVLLADRASEHPVSGARISQRLAAAARRDHGGEARDGRPAAGGRRPLSVGTVGRHDQARGAGARARARSGTGVPGRADLRPRSDRRGRLRRTGEDAPAHFGPDRFHGNPRSRQSLYRLRPHRRFRERQDHCRRIDRRHEGIAASLAASSISTASAPALS